MPIRQTYASQLNEPLLAAVSLNTFTGPQNLIRASGNGAYQAPPTEIQSYYLKRGTKIRTEAEGTFSTTGTPTLVFGVYFGTTPLGVNVALTTASGAVTLPWRLYAKTHVRNTDVPSAVVTTTTGWLEYGTTLTAITRIPIPGIAQATVNVDNSVTAELSVQATYSASSASNIVVLHDILFEEVTQF